MSNFETDSQPWLAVIGRSLAQIGFVAAGLKDETTVKKAAFLEGLGLSRKDVAAMLGTTPASISELLRQAKNRKRGGKGRGKK